MLRSKADLTEDDAHVMCSTDPQNYPVKMVLLFGAVMVGKQVASKD